MPERRPCPQSVTLATAGPRVLGRGEPTGLTAAPLSGVQYYRSMPTGARPVVPGSDGGPAMRRFWTMLAHSHGQTWNASGLGRSLGTTDKTVRGYLDLLTGTYMVRQLQPWHETLARRQVKAPIGSR